MNDSPPSTPESPAIAGDSLIRIDAHAVADERGVLASPASMLLGVSGVGTVKRPGGSLLARDLKLLAVGRPESLPEHSPDRVISRPGDVLLPPLVNAHTHLDLTHMGPREHDPEAGFVAWVDQIRAERHQDDDAITRSVLDGAELLLRGGTAAVGDIAGAPAGRPSLAPWRALRQTPLTGTSFLEFFGIGAAETRAREAIAALLHEHHDEITTSHAVRFGLQPHAPNTVAISLYQWVMTRSSELGIPLSTHLSETPEEIEFIAHASGPQRELLERLGVWTDDIEAGRGLHPIEHLRPFLEAGAALNPPPLVAHVNALGAHASLLAGTGVSVAYCPRASAYFDAQRHFGAHPYRELLDAGVNVCLGTDSIVNLPPETCVGPDARISVLDEMRLLFQRDAAPPGLLLAMGTTHGARALGLDAYAFRFDAQASIAGVIAAPGPGENPLESMLRDDARPRPLALRNLTG